MKDDEKQSLYRNIEGYMDPTAGEALSAVGREEKRKRHQEYIHALRHRRKVYVVSRYRGDVEANTSDAIRACRYVLNHGRMPIARHLLYPRLLDDSVQEERDMGCQFGLVLLAMSDEVWIFHRNAMAFSPVL